VVICLDNCFVVAGRVDDTNLTVKSAVVVHLHVATYRFAITCAWNEFCQFSLVGRLRKYPRLLNKSQDLKKVFVQFINVLY
jgi:hypothetical protein